ncbi:MAG: PadR family transcriptional regulator [Streptomycetaceae bacterium]|jgi:PadR family transcriptional regulator AphA|nr:PadR family transcriptional regulator [Streptomycetaceae bacterium]NUS56543.1 PadR family transcriptional regulator [Streptomycetaceae bacterium]
MQLDFVILGMLALRRFSGYDLRKWMEGPLRFIGYGVQLPQIYRRLGKLVERGWIEFDIDARQGGPDAKVYRMTEAGREALWEWARSEYVPAERMIDPEFTIRYVFGGQLDPEIAIRVVRTELEFREKQIDPTGNPPWIAEARYEDTMAGLDQSWAREVHLSGHEYGYSSHAMYITWLKLTLHRLERAAEARKRGAAGD